MSFSLLLTELHCPVQRLNWCLSMSMSVPVPVSLSVTVSVTVFVTVCGCGRSLASVHVQARVVSMQGPHSCQKLLTVSGQLHVKMPLLLCYKSFTFKVTVRNHMARAEAELWLGEGQLSGLTSAKNMAWSLRSHV